MAFEFTLLVARIALLMAALECCHCQATTRSPAVTSTTYKLDECITACWQQIRVVRGEIDEFDKRRVSHLHLGQQGKIKSVAVKDRRCHNACQVVLSSVAECITDRCVQQAECLAACLYTTRASSRKHSLPQNITDSMMCARQRLTLENQGRHARLDVTLFWILPLTTLSANVLPSLSLRISRQRYNAFGKYNDLETTVDISTSKPSMAISMAEVNMTCFGYNYHVHILETSLEYGFHTFDVCSPYLFAVSADEQDCQRTGGTTCSKPCPTYRQQCNDTNLLHFLKENQNTGFDNSASPAIDVYPLISILPETVNYTTSCNNLTRQRDSILSSITIRWRWKIALPFSSEVRDYDLLHKQTCWCQQRCSLNFTVTIINDNQVAAIVTSLRVPSYPTAAESTFDLPVLSCSTPNSMQRENFTVKIGGHYEDDVIFSKFMEPKRVTSFSFAFDRCSCAEELDLELPVTPNPTLEGQWIPFTTPTDKVAGANVRQKSNSPSRVSPWSEMRESSLPPHASSSTPENSSVALKVILPTVIVSIILLLLFTIVMLGNVHCVPRDRAQSKWRKLFSTSDWTKPPSPLKFREINTKVKRTNYSYVSGDILREAAKKGDWYTFPSELEFPVKNLTLERQLGTGQFGCVWLAKATGINEDERWSHVAVKMLREGSPEKDAEDFFKEAQYLSSFCHPNIINLIGLVVHGNPKMVVLEYMDGGDLKEFLEKKKASGSQAIWEEVDFVDVALDIAKGLQYLQKRKFVHRDVAARNCLVSFPYTTSKASGIRRITKLADFGMTRHLRGSDAYTLLHNNALLPIRWLAPECISSGVFTHASDVWSFGILLWEIYTFGETPYGTITASHAVTAHICSGKMLAQPDNCPRRMYALMRHCWAKYSRSRPSFTYIVTFLESFQQGYLRRRTQSTTLTLSTLEASIGEYLGSMSIDALDRCFPFPNTCSENPTIVIVKSTDEADGGTTQYDDSNALASKSFSNLSTSNSENLSNVFQPPTPDVFLMDDQSDWSSTEI